MIKQIKTFLSLILLLGVLVSCKSTIKMHMDDYKLPTARKREGEDIEGKKEEYYLHKRIKTTYFYIGERTRGDFGVFDNTSSAWTADWVKSYGGIDYPHKREGYFPKDFYPLENPFYCALPYNDISMNGHKEDVLSIIPWAKDLARTDADGLISYCKNQWVKIIYKDRACYAQWEDVGPFETDDRDYVFGAVQPKNSFNGRVGLDISPACFDYLGLEDNDFTDWQFVDFIDVPDGPWLEVITISKPGWN